MLRVKNTILEFCDFETLKAQIKKTKMAKIVDFRVVIHPENEDFTQISGPKSSRSALGDPSMVNAKWVYVSSPIASNQWGITSLAVILNIKLLGLILSG